MIRTLLLSLLMVTELGSAEIPFKRGVNLTSWLQTSSARQIQFTKFTRQDLVNIQTLGCDVIRLPINLHAMTSGAPNYTIDPLFYFFLDQIVDWAEELNLHLILDNHTFDPAVSTDPNIGQALLLVWAQMAGHYMDRSTLIYYEVLNEPHGISDVLWNDIQQQVIDVIRSIDQKHNIIIGPAGWNSYYNLTFMPEYEDELLIYTFHFYDPFLFTHQGASWTDPSLAPLAGVPFPYQAARMPACPTELKGTWVEGSLAYSYKTDGTIQRVKELIDIAANFKTQRNVQMLCGEFGVFIPNAKNLDRIVWYDIVRRYLEEKGIAWTIWGYTGGFGLFEAGTNELFDYDLNVLLLQSLGLNVPPQKEFNLKPDSTGFGLYLDYIGPNILESSGTAGGVIDYYSEDDPVSGQYCIYWTEAGQYEQVGFDFKPNKDLSFLKEKEYAIDFWVRCLGQNAKIDIRFIDTKTNVPTDHPWRMKYTLDRSIGRWDGTWHRLRIPLKNFIEGGSWDNGWFNPQNSFDWTAIDRFEFVSEHHDLKGIRFWIDDLRVVSPTELDQDTSDETPGTFALEQNYPNPFNASTSIVYQLTSNDEIEMTVYDMLGQKIRKLLKGRHAEGQHSIVWDGLDDRGYPASSGVYFCEMKARDFLRVRKMIMMR